MASTYSKIQWCILFVLSFVNFLCSICTSSVTPFYPMIAQTMGATPTEYAIVLGIFGLSSLIFTPITGVLINKYGAVKVSLAGLSLVGASSIMLGFADRFKEKIAFILASAIARIITGIGYAMVRNSGYTIVSCEFSKNVEMAFSFFQAISSLGRIMGPAIGGALIELGGFTLTFTAFGSLLLCSAFALFLLPNNCPKQETKLNKQILKMFRIPEVIFGSLLTLGAFFTIGFTSPLIEPHIRRLDLSPVQVGSAFTIYTLALSCSSFAWSKLCEKFDRCDYISVISSLIVITGLMLFGPAPYLPVEYSFEICILGLVIYGIGLGGMQVCGFSSMNKGARLANFTEDDKARGFISTIYTSYLNLGFFTGSLVGGPLYDTFDFPWASHFLIGYFVLQSVGAIFYTRMHTDSENIYNKLNESAKSVNRVSYESTK